MSKLQIYDFGICPNRWTKSLEVYRGGCVKPNRQQVEICRDWLGLFATKARSQCCPKSSYFLKHQVEKWADAYVTNGALIAAGVAMGYEFEHRQNSINVGFFINLKPEIYKPIQGNDTRYGVRR